MKILFKSPWNKVKGQTKILCSKLTHDELLRIEGEKDKLIASLHRQNYNRKNPKPQKTADYFSEQLTRDDCH